MTAPRNMGPLGGLNPDYTHDVVVLKRQHLTESIAANYDLWAGPYNEVTSIQDSSYAIDWQPQPNDSAYSGVYDPRGWLNPDPVEDDGYLGTGAPTPTNSTLTLPAGTYLWTAGVTLNTGIASGWINFAVDGASWGTINAIVDAWDATPTYLAVGLSTHYAPMPMYANGNYFYAQMVSTLPVDGCVVLPYFTAVSFNEAKQLRQAVVTATRVA